MSFIKDALSLDLDAKWMPKAWAEEAGLRHNWGFDAVLLPADEEHPYWVLGAWVGPLMVCLHTGPTMID